MGNKTQSPSCASCHAVYASSNKREKICKVCRNSFCNECCSHIIVLKEDARKFVEEDKPVESSILCLPCFKQNSTIDFGTDCDIVGPENSKTLLWLHGAASCRKMFRIHADMLATQGYRSILIDLPAHGTQMDTPLTIENCVELVHNMRVRHCKPQQSPIIIGGSLGGYMAIQVIRKYSKTSDFAGAVIAMASQNVGEGRSFKASLLLFFINASMKLVSPQTMGRFFLKFAKNVDKDVLITLGTCGLFFNQPERRTPLLQQTHPFEGIQKYEGPILFMNGEKDSYDSLELWSKSTQVPSECIMYKDADHFFSHDRRYLTQFADDIKKFGDKALQSRHNSQEAMNT